MRFENKMAVVTGGAHGIGKAIADQFRAEGAIVHVIEIQPGYPHRLLFHSICYAV